MLKKRFKHWHKNNSPKKIVKIAQGDNNLIVIMTIYKRTYQVTVFMIDNNNTFALLEHNIFKNRRYAEQKFKNIIREF